MTDLLSRNPGFAHDFCEQLTKAERAQAAFYDVATMRTETARALDKIGAEMDHDAVALRTSPWREQVKKPLTEAEMNELIQHIWGRF
jgi:hypothetical protein